MKELSTRCWQIAIWLTSYDYFSFDGMLGVIRRCTLDQILIMFLPDPFPFRNYGTFSLNPSNLCVFEADYQ